VVRDFNSHHPAWLDISGTKWWRCDAPRLGFSKWPCPWFQSPWHLSLCR